MRTLHRTIVASCCAAALICGCTTTQRGSPASSALTPAPSTAAQATGSFTASTARTADVALGPVRSTDAAAQPPAARSAAVRTTFDAARDGDAAPATTPATPSLPAASGATTGFTASTGVNASTVALRTADATIARMSLAQRVGEHFIGHIPRSGLSDAMLEDVRRGLYGGFILYPWNYKSADQVRELINTLQKAAAQADPPVELFISVDQEGGRVDAFRFPEFPQFPSQFAVGSFRDPTVGWATGYIVGVELRSLGVNMNFAPVVDLYPQADSSIIGDRSFGSDPYFVSQIADAYIHGAEAAGIIPVAKHFPGHGEAHLDSHLDLPVVDLDEQQLLDYDLIPFQSVIDNGVPAIMTAHILYPEIDPDFPATLSETFLQKILRRRLGFNGLIITDGISMGALSKHYTLQQTLRRALEAGVDMLLDNAVYDVPQLVSEVETMERDGEVTDATIDAGVRKVLELKALHGMLLTAR